MSVDIFQMKYLKYKKKYLELKIKYKTPKYKKLDVLEGGQVEYPQYFLDPSLANDEFKEIKDSKEYILKILLEIDRIHREINNKFCNKNPSKLGKDCSVLNNLKLDCSTCGIDLSNKPIFLVIKHKVGIFGKEPPDFHYGCETCIINDEKYYNNFSYKCKICNNNIETLYKYENKNIQFVFNNITYDITSTQRVLNNIIF